MSGEATPFRWPGSWTEPALVDLLRDTPFNYLLIPDTPEFERVRARAKELGIAAAAGPPPGVTVVEGAWPGVKAQAGGGANAGPTGVPWVDSNGWLVRLNAALHPGTKTWVEAPPKDRRSFSPYGYQLAVADVAAHGGRWIASLDEQLAAKQSGDSPAWRAMLEAARYFAARPAWSTFVPGAVLGVVSDFAGPNEFMGQELLNLLARAGMHYRIVPKDKPDLSDLRAVLYADRQAPSADVRARAAAFTQAGGLLITTPVWGAASGPVAPDQHPRFTVRTHGKGRIATALSAADDPWQLANDAVVLVSHRYDLVRCFNSGSFASYLTWDAGRKHAIVHLLFYADRGPPEASVRIAGRFRAAAYSTIEQPALKPAPAEFAGEWVEAHLPPVPPYVALELTA